MGDRPPAFPSITELFQHGLVAAASVASGLVFVVVGATGDLALSNKKLLLGASLIFFGIAWHYGSQAATDISDARGTLRTWDKSKLFTSILFSLLFMFPSYQLVTGRSLLEKKVRCEKYARDLQSEFSGSGDKIPGVANGSYYIERSFYSAKRDSCICVLGAKQSASGETGYDMYMIDSLTKKLLWSRRFKSGEITSGSMADDLEAQVKRNE